jgi:hypothetical protein
MRIVAVFFAYSLPANVAGGVIVGYAQTKLASTT